MTLTVAVTVLFVTNALLGREVWRLSARPARCPTPVPITEVVPHALQWVIVTYDGNGAPLWCHRVSAAEIEFRGGGLTWRQGGSQIAFAGSYTAVEVEAGDWTRALEQVGLRPEDCALLAGQTYDTGTRTYVVPMEDDHEPDLPVPSRVSPRPSRAPARPGERLPPRAPPRVGSPARRVARQASDAGGDSSTRADASDVGSERSVGGGAPDGPDRDGGVRLPRALEPDE